MVSGLCRRVARPTDSSQRTTAGSPVRTALRPHPQPGLLGEPLGVRRVSCSAVAANSRCIIGVCGGSGTTRTAGTPASAAAIARACSSRAGISASAVGSRVSADAADGHIANSVPPIRRRHSRTWRDVARPARPRSSRAARRCPCRTRRTRCRRAPRSRPASVRTRRSASHSRAPSRCTAAPRSRAHAVCADQVVPRRQLAAEVALRQLQQQRGDRLGDALSGRRAEQPLEVADRPADELVQPGVALALVPVEVAVRVPDDRAAGPLVGVHAQRGAPGPWCRWAGTPRPACRAASATCCSSSVTTPPVAVQVRGRRRGRSRPAVRPGGAARCRAESRCRRARRALISSSTAPVWRVPSRCQVSQRRTGMRME